MKYKIVITTMEPNPDYETQLAQYREKERYNLQYQTCGLPSAEVEVRKLETVLTEDEFNAVRMACLAAIGPQKDSK